MRIKAQVIKMNDNKYRFLTEKECWRLQGYDDLDFLAASKVNTKRALYKQAGNSISITIMEAIFKELFRMNVIT